MTSQTETEIQWEAQAFEKYQTLISKIPIFHREIAKQIVDKKAVEIAKNRGSAQVEADDIVQAFFTEVPNAFYSLMVRLMDEVNFDYKKFQ